MLHRLWYTVYRQEQTALLWSMEIKGNVAMEARMTMSELTHPGNHTYVTEAQGHYMPHS